MHLVQFVEYPPVMCCLANAENDVHYYLFNSLLQAAGSALDVDSHAQERERQEKMQCPEKRRSAALKQEVRHDSSGHFVLVKVHVGAKVVDVGYEVFVRNYDATFQAWQLTGKAGLIWLVLDMWRSNTSIKLISSSSPAVGCRSCSILRPPRPSTALRQTSMIVPRSFRDKRDAVRNSLQCDRKDKHQVPPPAPL